MQPESGNIKASRILLLGRNPFLVGYGYVTSSALSSVQNIDVAIVKPYNLFGAEIDGSNANIVAANQHYSDIRVHGDVDRVATLRIEDTEWGASTPAQGNIRNVVFDDVIVYGRQINRSIIKGKDSQNRISVTFRNLNIGGTYVSSANRHQYFEIDPITSSVNFEVTKADTTQCRVFVSRCPSNPSFSGNWYSDSFGGADSNQSRCMQRVSEVKRWCQQMGSDTVKVHYYKNSVFQQGTEL